MTGVTGEPSTSTPSTLCQNVQEATALGCRLASTSWRCISDRHSAASLSSSSASTSTPPSGVVRTWYGICLPKPSTSRARPSNSSVRTDEVPTSRLTMSGSVKAVLCVCEKCLRCPERPALFLAREMFARRRHRRIQWQNRIQAHHFDNAGHARRRYHAQLPTGGFGFAQAIYQNAEAGAVDEFHTR